VRRQRSLSENRPGLSLDKLHQRGNGIGCQWAQVLESRHDVRLAMGIGGGVRQQGAKDGKTWLRFPSMDTSADAVEILRGSGTLPEFINSVIVGSASFAMGQVSPIPECQIPI